MCTECFVACPTKLILSHQLVAIFSGAGRDPSDPSDGDRLAFEKEDLLCRSPGLDVEGDLEVGKQSKTVHDGFSCQPLISHCHSL